MQPSKYSVKNYGMQMEQKFQIQSLNVNIPFAFSKEAQAHRKILVGKRIFLKWHRDNWIVWERYVSDYVPHDGV